MIAIPVPVPSVMLELDVNHVSITLLETNLENVGNFGDIFQHLLMFNIIKSFKTVDIFFQLQNK